MERVVQGSKPRFWHSQRIVFAVGSKNVQYLRVFESRCLMLDVASHNHAVTTPQFDRFALDAPLHNIDKLFVRMAVTCTFPSLEELMAH